MMFGQRIYELEGSHELSKRNHLNSIDYNKQQQ